MRHHRGRRRRQPTRRIVGRDPFGFVGVTQATPSKATAVLVMGTAWHGMEWSVRLDLERHMIVVAAIRSLSGDRRRWDQSVLLLFFVESQLQFNKLFLFATVRYARERLLHVLVFHLCVCVCLYIRLSLPVLTMLRILRNRIRVKKIINSRRYCRQYLRLLYRSEQISKTTSVQYH